VSPVLVAGAGRGIGRAITGEFIRRGHRVIGTARDPRSLQDLDLAERLALDVTDDASVAAAFKAAGDVDIVCDASGGARGRVRGNDHPATGGRRDRRRRGEAAVTAADSDR